VAEKLVLTAGGRGIPVAIYRPGPVSGHSKSGVTNMADMMSNLVRACLLLGAVPELDIMVDIVPVDFVSEAIVELSLRQESFGTIFHLANPRRWAYADVVSWLQEQMQTVESLPYEVWRERLITLARQLGGAEWGPFLPLLEEAESGQVYMPAFDTRNVLQGLQDSDILCAPVGPQLLGRYLSYLSQQGFIPAPAGRSES
jgi:thioester reductase-like protein